MKVVITGANGFIGRGLYSGLSRLDSLPLEIIPAVRLPQADHEVAVGDIHGETHWKPVLSDADVVIHTAAQAAVSKTNPESIWQANVEGTVNLARQAAKAGVKRFIFLSSVKIHGESSQKGAPFHENSPKEPQDLYAQSNLAAEAGLLALGEDSNMEVVILRLPLVYGPGVKGNFRLMVSWVQKQIPLPLGTISNQRSLLSLGNLVDFIGLCLNHPRAVNQTFLVADGCDLSTTGLLESLGVAFGKPARLLSIPTGLLNTLGVLVGKGGMVRRLTGDLQLDISKARQTLDWQPPLTLEQGFSALLDDSPPE